MITHTKVRLIKIHSAIFNLSPRKHIARRITNKGVVLLTRAIITTSIYFTTMVLIIIPTAD
jgi:hypothetical protein